MRSRPQRAAVAQFPEIGNAGYDKKGVRSHRHPLNYFLMSGGPVVVTAIRIQ